jgi:hypothetical protein
VPVPYEDAAAEMPFARNSFGFTLSRVDTTSCQYVADVYVTRNYVLHSSFDNNLDFGFTRSGCVRPPTSFGQLNHFEVRLSVSHVEVWGTDAGTTAMRQLLVADNVNVPLTRGLIWVEDVHYNACKSFGSQCDHTFVWDNVGFDGPILPRDWATDVNDRLAPLSGGSVDLGWSVGAGGTTPVLSLPTIGADKIAQASGALLTLNFGPQGTTTLTYRLNGGAWHTQAWPYADNGSNWSWRTLAVPVPLTDVKAGPNTVEIQSSAMAAIANVDLILIGGGGPPCSVNPSQPCSGGTPSPTPTRGGATATATSLPATATRTASPSPAATATLLPPKATRTSTPTPTLAAATATPTRTATPSSPTITPTALATAQSLVQCSPRPPVGVSTSGGAGQLRVVVSAETNAGTPTNWLHSISFASTTNALVSTSGATTGSTSPSTVSLAPGTQQYRFSLRRMQSGSASTVNFTVTDNCGAWPTFVGGGTNGF